MNKKNRIFLDHASTTPLDPRAFSAMKPFFGNIFANPSALYEEGVLAKKHLSFFRKNTAESIGALSDEIVFTGSGTESVNLAILGVFENLIKGFSPHMVVSEFEHPAVLESALKVKSLGGTVSYLKPNEDGFINPKDLRKVLKPNTVLISIMHANNEIGTIQPIMEIAKEIRNFRKNKKTKKNLPYFHVDASQSVNYCDIDVRKMGVDLLTLDGSKIYGPKGVGILFIRRGVKITPQILGGGQESGIRSGTENLALIAGFSKALEITSKIKAKESLRLERLRDYAIDKILKKFPKASLNGAKENRLPNNINICFPGIDGEFAVIKLDHLGFLVSSSSSCGTLAEDSRSYVVESIGKKDCADSSIRITLGRSTSKKNIDDFVEAMTFLA